MLIGARPDALPMLIAEVFNAPLSIENVPEVGPVIVAPRTDRGPFTTVVVAARPMVTAPAFAVPMLIGASPEAFPRLIAEALPLSIANAPLVGPVIVPPRTGRLPASVSVPASVTENFDALLAQRSPRLPAEPEGAVP